MQLGITPFLIGDIDTRPFKNFINWDEVSFYTNDFKKILDIMGSVGKKDLITMGEKAKIIYEEKLAYQKWCPLVLKGWRAVLSKNLFIFSTYLHIL